MSAGVIVALALVYGGFAFLAFRWTLRRVLRAFPSLPLETGDVLFAALMALLWPVSVPIIGVLYSADSKAEWSRLRRWVER